MYHIFYKIIKLNNNYFILISFMIYIIYNIKYFYLKNEKNFHHFICILFKFY